MNSVPTTTTETCPAWCDPGLHRTSPDDVMHRSAPLQIVSTADDRLISVAIERIDEIGDPEGPGEASVVLQIVDTASYRPGPERSLDAAMAGADVRLLIGVLAEISLRFDAAVTALSGKAEETAANRD